MSSSARRATADPAQPATDLPAALTLVVGLGEQGGAAVAGLAEHVPFSSEDGDPRRHLGRMTLLCSKEEGAAAPSTGAPRSATFGAALPSGVARGAVGELGRFLAGSIVRRLEAMLRHSSVEAARGTQVLHRRNTTTVLVLLVASAEEQPVREVLQPLLESFEDLVMRELGPIFGGHRDALRRNLSLLPVLTIPYVPAAPEGASIAGAIAGIYRLLESRPARLIPTLYLLQRVTDLSVLEAEDVVVLLQSFCLFVAEALASCGQAPTAPSGGESSHKDVLPHLDETLNHVLGQVNVRWPLATAVVARAEPRGERMREFARCTLALRVIRAIRDTTAEVEGIEGRDEVAAKVLEGLLADVQSSADTAATHQVKPYVPAGIPIPRWHALKEEVEAAAGPHPDPASAEPAQCPLLTPWLHRYRKQWADANARLFEAGALDGLMEESQARMGQWEGGATGMGGVRDRIQRIVDETLGIARSGEAPLSPSFLRQAAQRAAVLLGILRTELGRMLAARDGVADACPPSIEAVEDAHAALLEATRNLPSVRPLGVGAAVAVLLLTGIIGSSLPGLATVFALAEGTALRWLFTEAPFTTALVTAFLVVAFVVGRLFSRRHSAALRALRSLNETAEGAFLGQTGSLRAYVRSCVLHAWSVARVGALARASEGVELDVARLGDIERAVAGAEQRYRKRLSTLGVVQGPDQGPEPSLDASRLFDDARRPLVWSLASSADVSAEVSAMARDLNVARVLGARSVAEMLSRWRDELPFLRDEPLDDALAEAIDQQVPLDFWEQSSSVTDSARRGLRDFARSTRESLPLGLGDVQEAERIADGLLLPPALAPLQAEIAQHADAALLSERARTERIYAVRIRANIDPLSIDWWPRPETNQPEQP